MEAILDGFDDSPESDPAFNVLATFNNEVRHCMCTLDAPADDDDFHAAAYLACDNFVYLARDLVDVWGDASGTTHNPSLGITLALALLRCRGLLLGSIQ